MKHLGEDIKKLYAEERPTLILILFNMAASAALLVFSLTKLNPDAAVVKVGYGDIGGYRDGSWTEMMAFPILALILGVLHSLIAVKIYRKRGAGMAKVFMLTTLALVFGAFVVLVRLSREGQ